MSYFRSWYLQPDRQLARLQLTLRIECTTETRSHQIKPLARMYPRHPVILCRAAGPTQHFRTFGPRRKVCEVNPDHAESQRRRRIGSLRLKTHCLSLAVSGPLATFRLSGCASSRTPEPGDSSPRSVPPRVALPRFRRSTSQLPRCSGPVGLRLRNACVVKLCRGWDGCEVPRRG